MLSERLDIAFFRRNASVVARRLLGCRIYLVKGEQMISGLIVETEAYLDRNDPACHAARGLTKSNATMFRRAGLLYVYPIHAKYCMNIVTGAEGEGQAVLIRAVQPIEGIDYMVDRTGREDLRMLTRGPGRLCQAFGVDRSWDGLDLTESDVMWITKPHLERSEKFRVVVSERIGVTSAHDMKLRYFVDGNRFVSGRSKDHSIRPIFEIPQ